MSEKEVNEAWKGEISRAPADEIPEAKTVHMPVAIPATMPSPIAPDVEVVARKADGAVIAFRGEQTQEVSGEAQLAAEVARLEPCITCKHFEIPKPGTRLHGEMLAAISHMKHGTVRPGFAPNTGLVREHEAQFGVCDEFWRYVQLEDGRQRKADHWTVHMRSHCPGWRKRRNVLQFVMNALRKSPEAAAPASGAK